MDYFLLETTGNLNDEKLCLVKDPPVGMGIKYYLMIFGVEAKPFWPENASIYLRPERSGIKLADLLGNTKSYLLLSTAGMDVIKKYTNEINIEYLPFTLYNQKNRVHSVDYWCINILGGYDCLNQQECGIEYNEAGKVVVIDQFILDPDKLVDAPHLFRINEKKQKYVISSELLCALKKENLTNIQAEKLEKIDA